MASATRRASLRAIQDSARSASSGSAASAARSSSSSRPMPVASSSSPSAATASSGRAKPWRMRPVRAEARSLRAIATYTMFICVFSSNGVICVR